jgi:hypothetical protein
VRLIVCIIQVEASGGTGSSKAENFKSQELFYDWIVALSSNSKTVEGVITVRDTHALMDRLRITPEDVGSTENQMPHWISGFQEPRDPDYYTRAIHIHEMIPKAGGVEISLRRAFTMIRGDNTISQPDFTGRSVAGKFANCDFVSNPYDENARSLILLHQFITLSTWKYEGPNNPSPQLIMDPNEPMPPLPPNMVRVTVEAHCEGDDCITLRMGELEVMRGR